jgi:hypothetical protein
MDQAAEPLSFAGEQGDPDCAVLDPPDPTLQPCARPVDDGSRAAGFGSAIPGICSSSLPLSWSLPWSADSDGAGVLVQDPAAAAFSAKSLIGAPVLGAGTSDPIIGTISLEGPSVVSSSLRAVLGPTSAPPTAIRYQWQRATPGSESFSDISGATGLANSPTAQDLGLSLRIQASLTNGAGLDNPALSLRSPVVQRLIEAQGNTLLSQNSISERLARRARRLDGLGADLQPAQRRERQDGQKQLRQQPHATHLPDRRARPPSPTPKHNW